MADVFISYSRKDGEFVRDLHAFLTDAGRDVWVDWEDIPPASQWEQDIYESIDSAESVVFVISADSLASKYCGKELARAEHGGKRIVPLAIDEVRSDAAPQGLRQRNWISCRPGDDRDSALAKLSSALDTDLAWAKAHTRLLVRAVEWDAAHDSSLLLRGKDLAAAEQTLGANAGKEPRSTELQQRYVLESRRVATRRQRLLLGGVTVALAVSVALGLLAVLQRNDARAATRRATSDALAAAANDRVASNPDQALLLALDAYSSSPSPDARNAAVAALENARKLGLVEFVHGDSTVADVQLAPDGRTIAVGSADGSVRLWDVRARTELATLVETGSPIVGVGFARGGRVVSAGSADGVMRLWNARTGDLVGPALKAGHPIVASAVSSDGSRAAALGKGGRVDLWTVATGRRRVLAGSASTAAALAFGGRGRLLAAATTYDSGNSIEGNIDLWDLASGRHRNVYEEGHAFAAVAFSGRDLVTGGCTCDESPGPFHGELRLWAVPELSPKPLATLSERSEAVAVSPSLGGRTIVVGADDGSIRAATRTANGLSWGQTRLHVPAAVAGLALAPDGRTVAVVPVGSTSVRVASLDGPIPFVRAIGRLKDTDALAFAPNGRSVVAGGGSKGVLVMPTGGGKPHLIALPLRGGSVDDVAVDSDGSVLAEVASADLSSEHWWNLSAHRRLGPSSNPEVRLSNESDDTLGGRAGVSNVSLSTVASNGHTFAFGDYDNRAWVWDSRSKAPARLLGGATTGGRDASPDALALSGDGTTLAEAPGGSSGIQLWDVRGRRSLGRPLPGGSGAFGLALSPDGSLLASTDGTIVELWTGILFHGVSDLRAQVCRLVAGDLTSTEWASIAPGIPYRRACS